MAILRIENNFRGKSSRETKQVPTAVVSLAERRANAFKKIQRRPIASGRMEIYVHPVEISSLGDASQPRQHPMLDTAAKNSAAQKECIYGERSAFCREDQQSRQTIVSESVFD